MFKRRRKEVINAVLDSEIESILMHTNYYDKIINGDMHCVCCHSTIEINNIGIIMPDSIEDEEVTLSFFCNNLDCIDKYKNGR